MNVRIAPSLLSADFGALACAAAECEAAGAEYLHFDVMDGRFVPPITFGSAVVRALRSSSKAVFDVHLMVEAPERFVEEFAAAGAQIITVHAEATVHLQRTLASIRAVGARAGVALNPATSLSAIENVLDDVDLVLVMTVNPGFGGQTFIPAMVSKIASAAAMLEKCGREIDLEVDGGISAETARVVCRAGANVLVAGSALYGHPEGVAMRIAALRKAALGGP